MKRFITLGIAAALSLGLGGVATAQTTMTRSHVTPNGAVHTTTRTETPTGSATTRTVERPDGTRAEVRARTDVRGDRTVVRRDEGRHTGWTRGHHYGWSNHRVCRTIWRHHHRVRTCTVRHRY